MQRLVLSLMFLLSVQSVAFGIDTPETLEGVTTITPQEAKDLMAKGVPLFDLRTPTEYAEEHIKGAIPLPYHEKSKKEVGFDASLDKFDTSKLPAENMILQCAGVDCWKSYKGSIAALKAGKKKIYRFRAGFPSWVAAKFPTEK